MADKRNLSQQKNISNSASIEESANLIMKNSESYSNLNPTISDPLTELTEDDIFRMKKLSISKSLVNSELGDQLSAISQVDSTSNFNDDDIESDISLKTESLTKPTVEDKHIVVEDFVFGRNRPEELDLNPKTVTVLNYPFFPDIVPTGENATEYSECFTKAKVYLVGTAHFSPDSQKDVINTIIGTQPDAVMVELCSSRIAILSMDEETLLKETQALNSRNALAIFRQNGLIQGILHVLLLSTSAHITRQLGMAPGGEFRAAHRASLRVPNCRVVLGDRPVQITLQRALAALSFCQKIKLFFRLIISNQASITQDDVERCKNKDLLEELLKAMAGQFPQLTKIFVDERDQYMTHILHTLVQKTTIEKWNTAKANSVVFEPVTVVAITGIGHVSGICENWNKHIDSSELLIIPEPTQTDRAIKFVFKAVFYGVSVYAIYRVGKFTCNKLNMLKIK